MASNTNEFRDRLERDELVLGMNTRHSRTSEIGPLLKDCGYHWLMLDDEHTPLNPALSYETLLSSNRAGLLPFVRTRRNDHAEIGVHLSNGAMGIFIPHVNTAEEAERAAIACRYPPRGKLSVPGAFPQLGYKPRPFDEVTEILNDQTMVVCMIESPEAVRNADAIAATPGVDILFIGASDLTYEMGIPSQYGDERVAEAVQIVCDAAKKHGKYAGIGGIKTEEQWLRYIGSGMRMIMTESDLSMLVARATMRSAYFSELHAPKAK